MPATGSNLRGRAATERACTVLYTPVNTYLASLCIFRREFKSVCRRSKIDFLAKVHFSWAASAWCLVAGHLGSELVQRGAPVPDSMKADAVVEAIFELRFAGLPIPEVFYGRMVDHPTWKLRTQGRLPGYDIPSSAREFGHEIRFAPVMELASIENGSVLRIGPYAVSYHRPAPYPGWAVFGAELDRVIDSLFEVAAPLTVQRLGLRYLNALRESTHGVRGVADLDLTITDSDGPILKNVNLNFATPAGELTECTVRIATREFVQGELPADTSLIVDVDVSTRGGFEATTSADVKKWTRDAHVTEKREFFHLFPQSLMNQLMEQK